MLSLSERIQQEIDQLTTGTMLFNPLAEMTTGQTEQIELRISKNAPSITTTNELKSGLEGLGVPIVETVKVGTFMQARLSGDGFRVSALTDYAQVVGSDGYTVWIWDLTALEPGEKKLNLAVTVRFKAEGAVEESKTYLVMNRVVRVHVNPVYMTEQFVAGNVAWLVPLVTTAIVVPVIGFALRRRRGRDGDGTNGEVANGQLVVMLAKYFSVDEMKMLATNLGVDYELVGGDEKGKGVYARELLLYFERRKDVGRLVEECKRQRPNVEWPAVK